MNRTFSLLYYINKQILNPKTVLVSIYLHITIYGKRAEISINRTIEPNRWNPVSVKAIGTNEAFRTINAFVESHRFKVQEFYRLILDEDIEISAETLKNRLLGKDDNKKTIMDIVNCHKTKMEALVGLEFAPNAYKKYLNTGKHLKIFSVMEIQEG